MGYWNQAAIGFFVTVLVWLAVYRPFSHRPTDEELAELQDHLDKTCKAYSDLILKDFIGTMDYGAYSLALVTAPSRNEPPSTLEAWLAYRDALDRYERALTRYLRSA